MIKNRIFAVLLSVAFGYSALGQSITDCKPSELKDTCKFYLNLPQDNGHPYHYDCANVVVVKFIRKEQVKEVEIPMFSGEAYIFIINSYNLAPGVKIDIYNKPESDQKRENLFSCKSTDGKKINIFEPKKKLRDKIYIDYTIDAHPSVKDDAPESGGCGMLVVGYK
jgi:hypothetical protein